MAPSYTLVYGCPYYLWILLFISQPRHLKLLLLFFFLIHKEGQNVCWMTWTLTRCMWLMPFDSLKGRIFFSWLLFLVWLNVMLVGSSPLILAVWIHGYCWMRPFPGGGWNDSLLSWALRIGEGGGGTTMGWVRLKGLSAFGIMIQRKYFVADVGYSPWWSVALLISFSTVHCKEHYLLLPQNISVPCL